MTENSFQDQSSGLQPERKTAEEKSVDERDRIAARMMLRPNLQAAITLKTYGKRGLSLSLQGLIQSLEEQTRASSEGTVDRAEEMLVAQAHTLDAIFNALAQQAALNIGEYMDACDKYLKLALRAQSQCRATWEALGAIKNPPVMGYVGQANIAHGHQQVNNASSVDSGSSQTENIPKMQNKLLEEKDAERLDTRASSSPGRTDPAMAAVGTVHGTTDESR